ncbi:MAG: hypothetical protein ABGY75_21890 [Gemmataceae bacterium]
MSGTGLDCNRDWTQVITDFNIARPPLTGQARTGITLNDHHSRRTNAVLKVLASATLSDTDYKELKERKIWFIAPPRGVSGWNGRIRQGHEQIIYLSPELEADSKADNDCGYSSREVTQIVAHELMHALLGHTDNAPNSADERAAWDKVVELGFCTRQEADAWLIRTGIV